MSDSTFDLLLSLPSVLACEILSDWLYFPCLVRLDSAYCLHHLRPRFLALYEQPELVCSLNYNHRNNIIWFLVRRIKINFIDVCDELTAEVASNYLEEIGRHITSVRLSKGASFMAIQSIASYCPNVKELVAYHLIDAVFELIGQLSNLGELDISFRNYLTSGPSTQIQLTNLRKLRMECYGTAPSDAIMYDMVSKCPALTHFSLLYGYSLNVQLATTMISGLSKLTALNCDYLQLNDIALAVIIDNCPLVEHLDLRNSIFLKHKV